MGITGNNRQEAAETLALQVLTWLAGNDDVFPVFLDATGASATEVAKNAGQPEFLGSVLDFLLTNDVWVTEFCHSAVLPYDAPLQARAALPGGEVFNWT